MGFMSHKRLGGVSVPGSLQWFVGMAMLFSVAACGMGVQSGIETANELIHSGQHLEAQTLLRNLQERLEADDDLSERQHRQRLHILDRLGRLNWIYLQDYKRALKDYQQLIQLYPKTDEAYAARFTVADLFKHKFGNLEAAIGELQTIVEKFPTRRDTKRAQLQIAKTYFQLRDYPQARIEAEKILKRWPKSEEATEARFQIANSYYVEGGYREAIGMYQEILDSAPQAITEALVFFELGNCFQELDDSERALAYYYECLKKHPDPLLVQRKIKRVRSRLNKSGPLNLVLTGHSLRKPAAHVGLGQTKTQADSARPSRVVTPKPAAPLAASAPDARIASPSAQRPVDQPSKISGPSSTKKPENGSVTKPARGTASSPKSTSKPKPKSPAKVVVPVAKPSPPKAKKTEPTKKSASVPKTSENAEKPSSPKKKISAEAAQP